MASDLPDVSRSALRRAALPAVCVIAGTAVGFLLGRYIGSCEPSAPSVRGSSPSGSQRPEAGKHDDGDAALADPVLARALVTGEDAGLAQAALRAFLAALPQDRLRQRGPGGASVRDAREERGWCELRWRVAGDGWRLVGFPADPEDQLSHTQGVIDACYHWLRLHGLFCDRLPPGQVRLDGWADWKQVVQASFDEFKARKVLLAQADVHQDAHVFVSRDAQGVLRWGVFLTIRAERIIDLGVCNYADPFDEAGEQELLKAILDRATGRDVRIRSSYADD